MKEEKRTVQQYGTIEFQLLIYEAGWKRDEEGNWEHNAKENFLERYTEVTLRYNPSNIVYLLVYT
jgi:putative transposase